MSGPNYRLPQAQMYLKSAQWGFKQMLARRPIGYEFRFHLIGVLASLRAMQHALHGHDRHLSPEHERVIGAWWKQTRPQDHPPLLFIKSARDQILKRGAFRAYATRSESDTHVGPNVIYDLAGC
jgi:hypothetical protein